MTSAAPSGARRKVMVSAMGITQILAWGSSYYLPAVLAKPIALDTGWSLAYVVAGLSCGLLSAGLCAPFVGRTIQRRGGRPVLVAGTLLLALGLALLAVAQSLPVFFLAWVVMGAGMSAGLYDAAFATVGRFFGRDARTAITTLTLFGGFASTVCWPMSAFFVEQFGWRGACFAYVAIHLLISLPLHIFAVPSIGSSALTSASNGSKGVTFPERLADVPRGPYAFALLALIITLAALTASMISVHVLAVLQLRGYELAAAVGLGAMIGPSQVGARIIERMIGSSYHPIYTMIASVSLIAVGVLLLRLHIALPAVALIAYGAGNGLHTIARGALPLVLFNPSHYAMFMGRLAFPSLIVQALAPSLGAWLLVGNGDLMLSALCIVVAANVLATLLLWHETRSQRV